MIPPTAVAMTGFDAGSIGLAAMGAWLLPFYHVTAWSTALYVIPVAMLIYFATVFLFLHLTGRKPRDLMHGLWSGEANNKGAP